MTTLPLKTAELNVGRACIRYAIRPGDSEQPLLLLNGIGASLELAEPFISSIPEREIIIFDMPGIGGSAPHPLPVRLSGYASLTETILSELSYPCVDVMGVSWGGALAQQFARDFPDSCRSLVLAATGMSSFILPKKWLLLAKMFTPKRFLSKDYLTQIAPEFYGGKVADSPELIIDAFSKVIPPSKAGYFHQLMSCAGWTSASWLRHLSQPALILAGKKDPLIPVAQAKVMLKSMPSASLEIVDDGHLFLLTQPDSIAKKIDDFLSRLF